MNRTVRAIAAGSLSLALAGVALAEQGKRGGRGLARIMDELQLTDAQRQKVQPILDEQRNAARGRHEKMRADREALEAAAAAARPDPTAVGQAFLALKADRDGAKAQREALHAKVAKILTPEQNAKLDSFLAGMRAGRGMREGRPGGM
jgi:Spy/CpxP family protein refolding chaperone